MIAAARTILHIYAHTLDQRMLSVMTPDREWVTWVIRQQFTSIFPTHIAEPGSTFSYAVCPAEFTFKDLCQASVCVVTK